MTSTSNAPEAKPTLDRQESLQTTSDPNNVDENIEHMSMSSKMDTELKYEQLERNGGGHYSQNKNIASRIDNSEEDVKPGSHSETEETIGSVDTYHQKEDLHDNISAPTSCPSLLSSNQAEENASNIQNSSIDGSDAQSRRTLVDASSTPRGSTSYLNSSGSSRHLAKEKVHNSLFCLGANNPIRKVAKTITESKVFEYFILLAIFITCLVMAIDEPLPEQDKSLMNLRAREIEKYLLGIFCTEACLKIIAKGFVMHPHSYLRSIWNMLDFVVVVTSIVTMPQVIGTTTGTMDIKWLRAMRVLRPLKLISGIPSLQVVMTSVVRAMFPLLQVLLLVIFVIIIYAIIGLEFMYKKYHYSCYTNSTEDGTWELEKNPLPCDSNVEEGKFYYIYGRRCPGGTKCQNKWKGLNSGITSYDNIFLSMITVFQCITMEGWTEIMYNTFYAIDEHGYLWAAYYISLIVIGSFFMLNLVLGVLSGEFAKEREKVENRRSFLKLRQEKALDRICDSYMDWIEKGDDIATRNSVSSPTEELADMGDIILNPAVVFNTSQYKLPATISHRKSKFDRVRLFIKLSRIKVKAIVKHKIFFWLVVSMVFVNTIIMATEHYGEPKWLNDFQDKSEIVFVSIFTIEVMLKLYGYGLSGYFSSMFNVFDLIVIGLSLLELIVASEDKNFDLGVSVLRSLRLLRAFKVTKYWSSLRNLVASLMNAMKSILSLLFLLFLFIVISALLGMQLFGGKFVKLSDFPRTNFDSFAASMLAVFQVITGEDWNAVMYNGILAYGGPTSLPGILCSLYFIFLVIFGNYTLLNVFLAIAVDNLTNAEILTHDEEAEQSEKRTKKIRQALQADKWLNKKAKLLVDNMQKKANANVPETVPNGGIHIVHNQSVEDEGRADGDMVVSNEGSVADESPAQRNGLTTAMNGYNGLAKGVMEGVFVNENVVKITRTPEIRRKSQQFELAMMPSRSASPNFSMGSPNADKYRNQIQKKWLKIVDPESVCHSPSLDIGRRLSGLSGIDIFLKKSTTTLNEEAKTKSPELSTNNEGNSDVETSNEDDEDDDISQRIKREGMLNIMRVNVTQRKRIVKAVPMVQKSSLFILSPTNRFRRLCHQIVNVRYFDWFIMLIIIVSSLTLACEDVVNKDSHTNHVLQYFDYFFTFVFGVEVILKVIDLGLIVHKGAYLRSYWNILDAFVFACNLASIIVSHNDDKNQTSQTVKALRVLRVLRPIKAIHKVKKLKAVFQCMVYSLKNAAFVLIITVLIMFIFANIGVQLFKGKFHYCTDLSKITQEECKGYFYHFSSGDSVVQNAPEVMKREWKKYKFNFDNIFQAMLTLYTCSTGEGWPNAMHRTIDATKEGEGPIINNKQHMSIFFIVFVVIFTFMIINIYIALIILTFQRQGENQIEGGLDRNQRDCLQFVLFAKPRKRYMPSKKSSLSYHVWYVVDSNPFEYFIMILIVLNTVQLMMKYNQMDQSYRDILTSLNIAFTVLFCVEAILKITAYRTSYFKDLWNIFDLFVIVGSVLDIVLTDYVDRCESDSQTECGQIAKIFDPTMFRLCRAARIAKLLRKGNSIRVMLWTFVQSFKALPYVTALILLLFYIYAVVGMQTFGRIKLGVVGTLDGVINEYNNFRNIIKALLLLFRAATGESWSSVMTACFDEAQCDEKVDKQSQNAEHGCGNTLFAIFYFISFIFFCMFLLLNLFVAVIMDNFEYLTRDSSILGPHHLDEFVRCWSEFDPKATAKIPHDKLCSLMCNLPPPVGFGKKCPKVVAYKRLIRMNMPVLEDQSVTFHTTLLALIRINLDIYIKGNAFNNTNELKRVIKSLWPKVTDKNLEKFMPKANPEDINNLTVGKIYCVKLLVLNFRAYKLKETSESSSASQESPSMMKRLNSMLPTFRKRHKHSKLKDGSGSSGSNRRVDQFGVKDGRIVARALTFNVNRVLDKNNNSPPNMRDMPRRRSSWNDINTFLRMNKDTDSRYRDTTVESLQKKDETYSSAPMTFDTNVSNSIENDQIPFSPTSINSNSFRENESLKSACSDQIAPTMSAQCHHDQTTPTQPSESSKSSPVVPLHVNGSLNNSDHNIPLSCNCGDLDCKHSPQRQQEQQQQQQQVHRRSKSFYKAINNRQDNHHPSSTLNLNKNQSFIPVNNRKNDTIDSRTRVADYRNSYQSNSNLDQLENRDDHDKKYDLTVL